MRSQVQHGLAQRYNIRMPQQQGESSWTLRESKHGAHWAADDDSADEASILVRGQVHAAAVRVRDGGKVGGAGAGRDGDGPHVGHRLAGLHWCAGAGGAQLQQATAGLQVHSKGQCVLQGRVTKGLLVSPQAARCLCFKNATDSARGERHEDVRRPLYSSIAFASQA